MRLRNPRILPLDLLLLLNHHLDASIFIYYHAHLALILLALSKP